jgi:hypothetical protein
MICIHKYSENEIPIIRCIIWIIIQGLKKNETGFSVNISSPLGFGRENVGPKDSRISAYFPY